METAALRCAMRCSDVSDCGAGSLVYRPARDPARQPSPVVSVLPMSVAATHTLAARSGAGDVSCAAERASSHTSRMSGHTIVAASHAQQSLWFLDRLNPGETAHNLSRALRLRGELDRPALERAVTAVVRRHEALRTTFAEADGGVVQVISAPSDVAITQIALPPDVAGADDDAVREHVYALAQQPFDLAAGPLFRATLLQIAEDDHVLLLGLHHAIADGWSLYVLTRDLGALYGACVLAEDDRLPPLAKVLDEHRDWQRRSARPATVDADLAFWRQRLAGAPATTEFIAASSASTERPRPRCEWMELSFEVSTALRGIARTAETSVFTLLLSALQCVIARYGQSDIVTGVPVGGRRAAEADDLIGMFVNRVAIRARLSGDPSFLEALARTRAATLEAYEHQDLPFDLLLERLHPVREAERHPYFQVLFNAVPWVRGEPTPEFAGLKAEVWMPVILEPDPTLDASIHVLRTREPFAFELWYDENRFDPAIVRAHLDDYAQLLTAAARDPQRRCSELLPRQAARIREMDGRARQAARVPASSSFTPFAEGDAEQTLYMRFRAQRDADPGRLAVSTPSCTWTYGELDRRVRAVAHELTKSIGPDAEHVALLVDHDAPMVSGVLGALAAGKAYVPLDRTWPEQRAREVIEDAGVGAILADRANYAAAVRLAGSRPVIAIDGVSPTPADVEREDVDVLVPPAALAYILYTSGSTGRPKGVAQSHRNVLAHMRAYTNALRIGREDRMAAVASYATDAAVMDLFGGLLNGASVHLFDVRAVGVDRFAQWLRNERITVYHSTPTLYRHLTDSDAARGGYPSIRLVVLGGEAARAADFEPFARCFEPECLLVNGLGPTESTLALQCILDRSSPVSGESLPVGYAVEGTEILLLDESGEPVEVLVRGEIAIRSAHLALGYWRRPALTALAFVPDPAGGGRRLYRTGDLGRRLRDGRMEYHGRLDTQVKIRGQRLELGEVEAVLSGLPTVREAAVASWTDEAGESRLVAYLVPRPGASPDPTGLRRALRERLPDYMIPATYSILSTLPLTPSGKVDRQALPIPVIGSATMREPYVPPRTEVEGTLASVWSELLGHELIGIDDDFFDLGGHSLLAMRLVARVRQRLGVDVPLRDVFDQPTISSLAGRIVALGASKVEVDALEALLSEIERLPDDSVADLLVAEDATRTRDTTA